MKEIQLTRGFVMLVSDHRFEELNKYNWQYQPPRRPGGTAYAKRGEYNPITRKTKSIMAHKQIMNPPKGMTVDHLNRNGLDNRDENLEVKSYARNLQNRGVFKTNKTGIRGVQYNAKYDKYRMLFQRYVNTKEEAGDLFEKIKAFVDTLYENGEFHVSRIVVRKD